jgi:guanine nucleotide-binding protein subunit alpha
LLLGSADSGKTTVLKQMKILYGTGFTNEERVRMKGRVKKNLIHNMKLLVNGLETLNIPIQKAENHVMT